MIQLIELNPSENILRPYNSHEDVFVKLDATNGSFTVTMPDAQADKIFRYIFKRVDTTTNTVTINFASNQTVDGEASVILENSLESFTLMNDFGNYWIVGQNIAENTAVIIKGLINDTESREIRIDRSTHTIQTIPYEHHEMHSGSHYFIKTFITDTAGSGSTTYFAFTTPDSDLQIHAKAIIAPDVDYESNIYEGASITGGTPITGMNNYRDSTKTAQLTPVAAPTVVSAGNLIWASRNGGGKNAVGVAPGLNYEIIAKRNSTYLFELIKRTTANAVVDIDFFWYEHTPKD